MVGVDVADEPVLQTALERIAPRMREDITGVGVNVDLLHAGILRADLAVNVHDCPPA